MKNNQAVYLWNGLCFTPFGGEWGGEERREPMGFTALGAGLPTDLRPRRHTAMTNEKADRKRVAEWLREWADALVEEDVD